MPIRLGRALGLALAGGALTSVCWFLLYRLVWMPFWYQLQRHGMYVHDVEGVYVVTFGPIIVAVLFLLTAFIGAIFERKRFENGQPLPRPRWRILFFGIFPAVMTFTVINGPAHDVWRYPLSELAVCVVGLALGFVWVRARRADEPKLIDMESR